VAIDRDPASDRRETDPLGNLRQAIKRWALEETQHDYIECLTEKDRARKVGEKTTSAALSAAKRFVHK